MRPDNLEHKNHSFGHAADHSAVIWFKRALQVQNDRDPQKAIACYNKALAIDPCFFEAWYNLGFLHYLKTDYAAAASCFQKAAELKGASKEAHFSLACALKENHCFPEAATAYQEALRLDPNCCESHFELSRCYHETKNPDLELTHLRQALAVNPKHAQAWFHLGVGLLENGPLDEILLCFHQATALKPEWGAAHHNLSVALHKKGRLAEAITHAKRTLELTPDFGKAREYLFRLAQHACDWPLAAQAAAHLEQLTAQELDNGLPTSESPMISLRRHADPARNLRIARSWSQRIVDQTHALADRPVFLHGRGFPERLRIGYLSGDFKDHAVAFQIRGMLNAHDRHRFEIFGYACNPDDGTRYRQLLSAACDQFSQIHQLSDAAAARRIHQDGIHILVDMAGHSRDARLGIAALRPAPLQVGYLGFLGTTGADFIDYMIADAVVVPPHDAQYYTEKLVYLPHCYQVNDDHLPISAEPFTRQEFNLPDQGFIYCCFNQPYKIDESLFNLWLAILKGVDGSVLWLINYNSLARENLIRAAEKAQVDPARLIFSGFLPLDRNLARLRLADLALDTLTYNGGATTSNALWAGVPVLTVAGGHWVSRMSASALRAAGLPELIADSRDTYRDMAIDLALHAEKLKALRGRLVHEGNRSPLFDTDLFTRHLEIAYLAMWQRFSSGLEPAAFKVKPLSIKPDALA